ERGPRAAVGPGGDPGFAGRRGRVDRREHLAQVRGALPVLGAISADLGRLGRDPVRPRCNLPLARGQLVEAIVGHDHRDLGDVVQLRVEAPELAVHEREGEVGQLYHACEVAWRSQRESNPCLSLERAASWTARRWERYGPGEA